MRRTSGGVLALFLSGCGALDPANAVDNDAEVSFLRADASSDRVAAGDVARTEAAVRADAGAAVDARAAADGAGPTDATPALQVNAWLELRAMDLWAQPLPPGDFTLTVTRDGVAVETLPAAAEGGRRLPLGTAATYRIALAAPGHRPLAVTLRYDGTNRAAGVVLDRGTDNTGQGLSLAHGMRDVEDRGAMVHTLWMGLRHSWFSAQGRPARRGNALRLLMDGEEAWGAVLTDLRTARRTVHAATWWWESDFELVRDPQRHLGSSLDQRRANTVLGVFESLPATRRVLVGQFYTMDGVLSTLSSDEALRVHGTTRGDNFEYMGQANPTDGMLRWEVPPFRFADRVREADAAAAGLGFDPEPGIASDIAPRNVDLTRWPVRLDFNHASYHQKFMVIDERVAFIGGMNLRRVDWDTSSHRVFEPRRMLLAASTENRLAVAAGTRLPDTGPRKDYMVRIEGPVVRDANDVFQRRWQYLRETGARYSDDATGFTVGPPPAPQPQGVQAQVTATLPAPFHEYAIAESWFNAIAQARDYIFIEDQYFRIPMLNEAIAARLTEIPTLRLVVVTRPINEWLDPGCAWTYQTHTLFRSRFPERYRLLQLRAFATQVTWGIDETDARFVDIDVHSKLLIVDDVFLSVGSANKNNRGALYEAELNLAVYDRAWVSAARRRVLANMLQREDVPDTTEGWWAALEAQRAWNDAVRQRWLDEGDDLSLDGAPLPVPFSPRGFVYTLDFGPVRDCLIEDVGPDVV